MTINEENVKHILKDNFSNYVKGGNITGIMMTYNVYPARFFFYE
jgi:hypothetical protein